MSHAPRPLHYRPALIGFTGHAGAGKDTAARILGMQHGFDRWAFADALRDYVYRTDPIVRHIVVHEGGWERAKRDNPYVRERLQLVGVHRREAHGPYYWVNKVAAEINDLQPSFVTITDVRFPNEAAWIRSNGGIVVRIVRDGVGPANNHVSERTDDLAAEFEVWNIMSTDYLATQLEPIAKAAIRVRDGGPLFLEPATP